MFFAGFLDAYMWFEEKAREELTEKYVKAAKYHLQKS